MISDLKEIEDVLMMRNGVNSIWMEGEETEDLLLIIFFIMVFPLSIWSLTLTLNL